MKGYYSVCQVIRRPANQKRCICQPSSSPSMQLNAAASPVKPCSRSLNRRTRPHTSARAQQHTGDMGAKNMFAAHSREFGMQLPIITITTITTQCEGRGVGGGTPRNALSQSIICKTHSKYNLPSKTHGPCAIADEQRHKGPSRRSQPDVRPASLCRSTSHVLQMPWTLYMHVPWTNLP